MRTAILSCPEPYVMPLKLAFCGFAIVWISYVLTTEPPVRSCIGSLSAIGAEPGPPSAAVRPEGQP